MKENASANFMQVVPCECGGEEMCLCGRCKSCGKQRKAVAEQEASKPSIARLREDCMRALSCLFIAVEESVAKDVGEKVRAYVSALEKPEPVKDDKLASIESRLETLWTEVFAVKERKVGDKDGGDRGARQTLRGAVVELCTINNNVANNIANEGGLDNIIVELPKAPWVA